MLGRGDLVITDKEGMTYHIPPVYMQWLLGDEAKIGQPS